MSDPQRHPSQAVDAQQLANRILAGQTVAEVEVGFAGHLKVYFQPGRSDPTLWLASPAWRLEQKGQLTPHRRSIETSLLVGNAFESLYIDESTHDAVFEFGKGLLLTKFTDSGEVESWHLFDPSDEVVSVGAPRDLTEVSAKTVRADPLQDGSVRQRTAIPGQLRCCAAHVGASCQLILGLAPDDVVCERSRPADSLDPGAARPGVAAHVHGTWRVRDAAGIAGSSDSASRLAGALGNLVGRALDPFTVLHGHGDIVLSFDGGSVVVDVFVECGAMRAFELRELTAP